MRLEGTPTTTSEIVEVSPRARIDAGRRINRKSHIANRKSLLGTIRQQTCTVPVPVPAVEVAAAAAAAAAVEYR